MGPNITDPTSLVTTASTSTTTTYTLHVKIRKPNLIVNGDFEQGNTIFTSDYIVPQPPYSPHGPLGPEGTYLISDDPSLTHNNFAPCNDHTSGNGNMMVVNGNQAPNANVWCQTVTVDPNAHYEFSTWATSVIPSNPAKLQFSIDGIQIGDIFNLSGNTCQWEEFYEEWDSDNSGAPYNVEICIVNKNLAVSGNDFALDDIYFGEVCEITDEKQVEILPNSEFTLDTLICDQASITLHNETFIGEGIHGPIILTASNGCDSLLSVNVTYLKLIPIIDNPLLLTCDNQTVTISATNSIIQPSSVDPAFISYLWTTPNGNIIAGNGTPEIIVDEPGFYYLSIHYDDGIMQCISEEVFVEVVQDTIPPEADILVQQEDCTQAVWTLTGNSSIPNSEYSWATIGGNIGGPDNQATALALAEGTYILEIRNPVNGCVGYDTVQLTLSGLNADILGDLFINCDSPTTILYADGATNYTYQWFTYNGDIQGNTTADSIIVSREGRYYLVSSVDDCHDTISVNVESFIDTITINLIDTDTLTCSNPEAIIQAQVNGATIYNISWTTADGNIEGKKDSTVLKTSTPGTYVIHVSTPGGCTTTDSVIIYSDNDFPGFHLLALDSLNCQNLTVSINAIGADTLDYAAFTWWTDGGNIATIDSNEHGIEVNQGGTYYLEVIDTTTGCAIVDSILIIPDTATLIVDAGPSDTLTCLQNSIQLQASVDSIQDLDSIAWTTQTGAIASGVNTLSPTVTATGTYYIFVWRKGSHCLSEDSVKIFIDDSKPFIVPTDNLVLTCKNPTRIIDKTGSTSTATTQYTWEVLDGGNILQGSNSYVIEVDAAGTYVFKITDNASGCLSTDTTVVTSDFEKPNISVPLHDTLTCSERSLEIIPENLKSYYGYQWTTMDGHFITDTDSAEVEIDAAGIYQLTVTDTINGCTQDYFTTIEIDTSTPEIVLQDSFYLTCVQMTITLNPEIHSYGSSSLLWTTSMGHIIGNPTNSSIQVDSAGAYTLHVKDNSSTCTTSKTVYVIDNITTPLLVAGPDLVITCKEPVVTAYLENVGSGLEIRWYDNAGRILAENTDSLLIDESGVYFVIVEDDNHCTNSAFIAVTENKSVEQVSAGVDQFIGCGKQSADLRASIPSMNKYKFVWRMQNGDTLAMSSEVSVDSPGIYQLIAINKDNGCMSTDSVKISLTDSIRVAYTLNQPKCIGENGSISVQSISGGLPDYKIRLNGEPVNLNTFKNLSPGEYELQVEDQLGCIYEEAIHIEEASPLILQYPDFVTIAYGDSIKLTPQASPDSGNIAKIIWTPFNNLSCSDCLSPWAFPENNITYFISLTDTNGCMVKTSVSLKIDRSVNFYIPNAFSPNLDGINDLFLPRIGKGVKGVSLMEIYNRWGDRVYVFRNSDLGKEIPGWDGTFKEKALNVGVYVYKIKLLLNSGEVRTLNGTLTLLK